MKQRWPWLVLVALLGSWAAPAAPTVYVLRQEGVIHGVAASILERALEQAATRKADLFILELDTPGGLVDAAEDMVREILASPVPVCVFVSPRYGAHAASAGFFLLLAADVAVMAPVTRTGASSVITLGGENKEGDIALKKASEDLSALIRSAARARGRPAEIAEKAVREAKSWSAEEALEARLIDFIADDFPDLLRRLEGREVARPDGRKLHLVLAGAEVLRHQLAWEERVRNWILQPTVVIILLVLAGLGLYIEFNHPGLILPGAVGVVSLLVFLYASQVIPISFFGAALVLLGLVLFILEIKVVSFGLLGVGGALAIALGLWLLFPANIPGLSVPLTTLAPVIVFMIAVLALVTWVVGRAMREKVTTGREGIVGEAGTATSDLAPEGTVFVHGEVWRARSEAPVESGARIRVVGVEGLTLLVEASRPGSGKES